MAPERIALVDLGTNTFHLLIIELKAHSQQTLLKLKLPVKLGRGGISKGTIAPDAWARATETLAYFKEEIDHYGVRHVQAVATSAMRNAANGPELVDDIKKRTGIDVEVISGDEEAGLIYKGVKLAMEIGAEPAMIMDIGGGSVEFIICTQTEIFWKQSFEVGAQRLIDLFHKNDPITETEIANLKKYLAGQLWPLTQAVAQFQPKVLIGSSGTFDTVSDIEIYHQNEIPDPERKEFDLSISGFYRIYHDLLTKTRHERMQIPGMIEMRVDMIVVASVLIDFVIENYRPQQLRVSSYALKEGLLSRLLHAAATGC